MEVPDLTPAEKVDAIYEILLKNESRQRRAVWFRIIKWSIILGCVYIVYANPNFFLSKLVEYVQPIVTEQMQSIIENQKDWLLQKMKESLSGSAPNVVPVGDTYY